MVALQAEAVATDGESWLETLPPEVTLHIRTSSPHTAKRKATSAHRDIATHSHRPSLAVSYLDLPELDALSRLSPTLRLLTQDPILHRRRITIIAPSRVQHALFAYGGALRPTVPDLVVRNVLRGLGIERRYRMGVYFNTREVGELSQSKLNYFFLAWARRFARLPCSFSVSSWGSHFS